MFAVTGDCLLLSVSWKPTLVTFSMNWGWLRQQPGKLKPIGRCRWPWYFLLSRREERKATKTKTVLHDLWTNLPMKPNFLYLHQIGLWPQKSLSTNGLFKISYYLTFLVNWLLDKQTFTVSTLRGIHSAKVNIYSR